MRYLLLALLLLPIKASDPLLGSRSTSGDYLEIETVLADQIVGESVGEAKAALDEETTQKILADFGNRIPDEFKVSEYFSPYIRFWFGIYTRYTNEHIVMHDKENLEVVYGVLDFSHVDSENINRFAKASIVQSISTEKISELRRVLVDLSQEKMSSKIALTVLKILQNSSNPPPSDKKKRKQYFLDRAQNIRTQTGQRNLIEGGIVNMTPFHPFFISMFEQFDLPPQLLAIPFLESSFNNSAHSKVGALGVWQFMPLISSYFMPKRNPNLDYRMNPVISTAAAMHLLRENKKILKSWDLAVTAYNSGTKHLVKARRDFDAHTLEDIFRQYDHPHLGFASKNFYAEFIALVHTLAYKNEIFPDTSATKSLDPKRLGLSLAKCSFLAAKESEEFQKLNPHLKLGKQSYPKGTIVVTYGDMSRRFLKLTAAQLEQAKPIAWASKYLKSQSCSTK